MDPSRAPVIEHPVGSRASLALGLHAPVPGAPALSPEQAVVLERNPARARAIARRHLATYLRAPNYTNNLRRLGFTDADFADEGSERLVDALVVWGDLGSIRRRIEEHLTAGADHVCLQVLTDDPDALPLAEWRTLAALIES